MHQNDKYTVEELAATETILKCALKIPRSLFCPYCAVEYMFDFSLKDHLLKHHISELKLEDVQKATAHTCPFCTAVFYNQHLIPKHVISSHGKDHLSELESNYPEFFEKDNADPSVVYAACSPGLSDIFDRMATNGSFQAGSPLKLPGSIQGSPLKLCGPFQGSPLNSERKPKSILKKTPSKDSPYKTINSPGVLSVKRNRKEIVKRTLSARRELRFDLPPLETSSPSKEDVKIEIIKISQKQKCFNIKKIFKPKKKDEKENHNKSTPNIVTSTPINFLDDSGSTPPTKMSKRKLKKKFTQNFRPLLFASERFQCAYCKAKYNCNGDLLFHLNDRHKGLHFIFRPKYQCGQCGDYFYMNNHLVRHCHFQHTPQKVRI
ncbi:hypothetical protein ACFFRR_004097 [Megaselia abdita]